jgi:hypothetical protein
MKILLLICVVFSFVSLNTNAQPYTDIASVSGQQLNTKYTNNEGRNITNNYFAGLLLPFKIDSSNTIIVRLNGEALATRNTNYKDTKGELYALTLGIGAQHYFNRELSAVLILMPKIASDFSEKINKYDQQYGGSILFQYKFGKNFRAKAGLFYNREPFGNFFVPLFGVDWQISTRWMLYGTFPLINRLEFKINEHFYTGLGARIYGRSYRLNSYWNHNYVWNQENQIKYFFDYYITKKLVCYTELGRTLGYGPKQIIFNSSRENVLQNNPLYTPIKQGFFVNVGFAFRIRTGI